MPIELRFEICQFLTNTSTKHEQNLKESNIKLPDFASFLQKVTLKGKLKKKKNQTSPSEQPMHAGLRLLAVRGWQHDTILFISVNFA